MSGTASAQIVHGIPRNIRADIVLIERQVEDIQRVATAMTALRGLHVGEVIVAMPADLYLATLTTLTKSIESIASEGGAS